MVADAPLSLHDRTYFLDFALRCTELLVIDDLWTEAMDRREPTSAELGHRMLGLIGGIREMSEQVSGALHQLSRSLNAVWPELRSQWLSVEQAEVLDAYIGQFGGFGDAAAWLAGELDESLATEADLIARKLDELEHRRPGPGDLQWLARAALGVLVIAAAALGVGLVAGAAAAVGVAATAVAAVGVAVTAEAIINRDRPRAATS